ncbi:MAG TPA: 6-carboxytetrahydropterin synthase [Gammaproteobacteria bacterium]|nr:6-carboxytetrahydropterin synthase [Gammaproteobacteria bacterium]
MRSAVIELHKEELKFSAGHFMLLSPTERESMHGHDYQIQVAFHTLIKHNGMAFDCRLYKQRLLKICQSLDYRFILPSQSEYMTVKEENDKWIVQFGQQIIPFLKQDAIVLPICNVTLEELSFWFIQQLTVNKEELQQHCIQGITVKIFNGRGESGATSWDNSPARF